MKLDTQAKKERFLKTNLGAEILDTVKALDFYITRIRGLSINSMERQAVQKNIDNLYAKWQAFQTALEYICKTRYEFTYTSAYYGITSKGENEWLFIKEKSSGVMSSETE